MSEIEEIINPIGNKYAALATEFLEDLRGRRITSEVIESLGQLLASVECDFCNLKEAADILGVSRQRSYQLAANGSMPPEVGYANGGKFWLKDDIIELGETRRTVPGPRPKT